AEQMSIRYKFKFHDQSAAEGEISNTVHNLAPHTNDAHIKKTDAVAAAPKNLKPGLEQVITSQQAEDRRVVRLPAIYVGKGDNPTDMIAGHGAFPFTSKWVGYLNIAARITPRFSLSGVGQATLKIDGKKVLKLNGKFDGKISDPIQLDPGAHQFELIYLSQRESGKHNAAQVRTLWQAEGIPLQSIPPKHFKHQPNKTLAQALAVRHGRDLVLQQNCTQCHHDANKSPLPELLQQGPDLTGIGGRAQAGWLAQWLATPHALKPGTTMPAFVDASTKQGKQDAADMAAYLASLQGEKLTDVAFGKDDAKLGGNRFHMLGCAACHTLPSKPFDAQGKRTPLNNIHTKFTPASLVAFLKDPNKYHQTIKMPDFQLGDEEARQLAAYLHVGSNGKGNEATELPSIGDAARGKQLIGKHNCAECHQGVAAASTKLPDFTAVLGKSWLKHGCASADKPSATPKLNLTKEERVSLEAYRAALAGRHIGTLAHTSSYDYAERQFKLLNCNACHARDDQASLLAKYHSDSKHLTKGIPEDHRFKVDQSRPHMTYIGEMLHTDYLQDMLGGKVKERARPWLAMRMPAFHNQNDLMARGLAAQHGMEPSKVDTANLDPQKVEAGKKLIGSSGGFACTICHANGQAKALAAFEVEGVNFDRVARRLRGGYYHRWMENPQSVTSNTKMPRYTTGNKSPLPDYNGDAQKQFDAIMEYFKSLEK
ncbi:MAG: c-type cytochrome, partial [Akkermansiaceae bacterium]